MPTVRTYRPGPSGRRPLTRCSTALTAICTAPRRKRPGGIRTKKQDPEGPVFEATVVRGSIVAAVEAVMGVVVISAIPGHHDDARIVAVMMPIEAMVMMVVMVMVELGQLDVFRRRNWCG